MKFVLVSDCERGEQMRTMSEETREFAEELLKVMKQAREKVMTQPIPKDLKEKKPEILIETFYMSMKDLIEKSIEGGNRDTHEKIFEICRDKSKAKKNNKDLFCL